MFKKFFNLLFLFFVIFTFFSLSTSTVLCVEKPLVSEKKVIVFIPGMCGSKFVFSEDVIDENGITHKKGEVIGFNLGKICSCDKEEMSKCKHIACGKNGKPVNDKVKIFGDKFLLLNKENILSFETGDLISGFEEYEVYFFNYDWRKGPEEIAFSFLEFFGDKENITVTLIGYSYGGLVTTKIAEMLYSLGEMSRINKIILLGTPLNGSPTATFLINKGITIDEKVSVLLRYIPSTYYLLPTKRFGNYFENDFSSSLGYDGVKNITLEKYSEVKPFFDRVEKFNDSVYKEGNHILTYYDTHLFFGTGKKTFEKINKKIGFLFPTSFETGDGIVLLKKSCDIGDIKNIKISEFNVSHSDFICEEVLSKIKEILEGEKVLEEKEVLENKVINY